MADNKLACYERRFGLDLMDALANDKRLRPTLVNGEYVVSLVDLMGVFGDSNYENRHVWRDQKKRLLKRKPELGEKISQLKLPSSDGKMYSTEVASIATCFRILLYMDTPSSDLFKDWAAGVLSRITEEQLQYRAANIAKGLEWAADSIHQTMIDAGLFKDIDDLYTED